MGRRKNRDRVTKGSDRMEGRVWDTPEGKVGVTDAEAWDGEEVGRGQRRAELAGLTDQPA